MLAVNEYYKNKKVKKHKRKVINGKVLNVKHEVVNEK